MTPASLWRSWTALFEEEPADAPRYDPVHLATVFVACQAAAGALFWLLWTLMVYEGGFGTGEGRLGNFAAGLILAAAALALRRAARKK
ncbi:MAG: hypothetical protein M0D55_13835 [Elusimicrobiota bacterium]|nr:MAG: hypothetical protein M0D55_13835 [Elusimicrobiota bacterium]